MAKTSSDSYMVYSVDENGSHRYYKCYDDEAEAKKHMDLLKHTFPKAKVKFGIKNFNEVRFGQPFEAAMTKCEMALNRLAVWQLR
jgi:hypothetical protein